MTSAEKSNKSLAGVGLAGAPVSRLILLANCVVYAAEFAYVQHASILSGSSDDPATQVKLAKAFAAFGANYAPFVFREYRLELLTTSCFVHLSLWHIAFNVAALRQIGPVVERTVGRARVTAMYMTSGIVASLASASWAWIAALRDPTRGIVGSVGASGAICGVLGAALVLGVRVQGWRSPIMRSILLWFALVLGIGYAIGADNVAHVVGALTGAAFGIAWRPGFVYSKVAARAILCVFAAIVVASFAVLVARDVFDPYATMNLDARVAHTQEAIREGDCAEALRSMERTVRITPGYGDVVTLRRTVLAACRKNQPLSPVK